jgi:AraC family transcriptional regulator
MRPSPEWLLAGLISAILMGCVPESRRDTINVRADSRSNNAMKPPDIVRREGFRVMGTVARRQPGTERPEMFTAIWKEFETHHEQIRLHSVDSKYYGVSFGAGQDVSFEYLAGMAVGRVMEIPVGVQVREVPAATYAVFACVVQTIGWTYAYIFGEWRPTSGYELDPTKFAFEQYPPAAETNAPVLVHIPIREQQMKSTPGQPKVE